MLIIDEKVHSLPDLASNHDHRSTSPTWPSLHELSYISHYQVAIVSFVDWTFICANSQKNSEDSEQLFPLLIVRLFAQILRKTRMILSGRQSKQRQSESNLAVNILSTDSVTKYCGSHKVLWGSKRTLSAMALCKTLDSLQICQQLLYFNQKNLNSQKRLSPSGNSNLHCLHAHSL